MNSVGNLQLAFIRGRDMSCPLNPYLILASIKSMTSLLLLLLLYLLMENDRYTYGNGSSAKFAVRKEFVMKLKKLLLTCATSCLWI